MKLHYFVVCALGVLTALSLPQSASAKCVARPVITNDGATETVVVVTPDAASAEFKAAGYKDAACGDLDKQRHREAVCDPASIGNRGVQRQLEVQAGISFRRRCEAARAEAGLPPLLSREPDSPAFSPSNQGPWTSAENAGLVGPLANSPVEDEVKP